MIRIPILRSDMLESFPPPDEALAEPNGLLAAGGDLSPRRLLEAYRHGIFPWFSGGEPILWWSPDPRTVFRTDAPHVSRRLRRWLAHCDWTISADTDFAAVMRACAGRRRRQSGTWITPAILKAYGELHDLGFAHSVEVRNAAGELVGGIYGVAIGRMCYGESMFSRATNGSKVALLALCRALHDWRFALLDAQVASEHLERMGAVEIPRARFIEHVRHACAEPFEPGSWARRWTFATPAALA
jgi:leucyl/phenylalanyl-tRNA--protein transferase